MAAHASLLELLEDDSDVQLEFDCGEVVPGHSQILQQWSGVLRNAIEVSNDDYKWWSKSNPMTIPMPGTSKKQWLAAAAFMYPMFPRAAVSWDNVKDLLHISSKYDCPVLLCEGLAFINTPTDALSGPDAWSWIKRLDALGSPAAAEVAEKCVTSLAKRDHIAFKASCMGKHDLTGLSHGLMWHIVRTLAAAPAEPGMFRRCSRCRKQCRFEVVAVVRRPRGYKKLCCTVCNGDVIERES